METKITWNILYAIKKYNFDWDLLILLIKRSNEGMILILILILQFWLSKMFPSHSKDYFHLS
jgi:hypothetical protein